MSSFATSNDAPAEQSDLNADELAEFKAGDAEQVQEQADRSDDADLSSRGGEIGQEADGLDTDNIIDDDSGPGGRSLRGTRGDPTASDKEIDRQVEEAENAE